MKNRFTYLIVMVLVLSGCGIPQDSSPASIQSTFPESATPQTEMQGSEESRTFTIYLLDADSRLIPVTRELSGSELKITDLINELIANPTEAESEMALSTAVPVGLSLDGVTVDGERAAINFEPGGLEVIEGEQLTEALAQIVWSVTESGDVVSLTISIADEIKTWPTPDEGDQNSLTRGQFISYAPQVSVIG
ncbi:MAG: GerMN domain-containing protein [Actinomycetota bacterium]|nr:GerMN domain-containing protein [Actinomycetota bacterium]